MTVGRRRNGGQLSSSSSRLVERVKEGNGLYLAGALARRISAGSQRWCLLVAAAEEEDEDVVCGERRVSSGQSSRVERST